MTLSLTKKIVTTLLAIAVCTMPMAQSVSAWNATGHQIVACIAWDNMSTTVRRNAITLLRFAPFDACLLDLFPNDSRPVEIREREFFMRASTWPDIVRPESDADRRPCTRFHRSNWHFINHFWQGTSGATGTNRPTNRDDMQIPELNAVERLGLLRPLAVCSAPACGTLPAERATTLAWILHIVGDIHQPLHTTARVTQVERQGDQGGNLFKLDNANPPLNLHSYWDRIVDRSMPKAQTESMAAYLERVTASIVAHHPRSQMVNRLRPGDFPAWANEGFETTKRMVYPSSVIRGQVPTETYRANAFAVAEEAIALGGYRLADLLNRMLAP